MGFQLASPQIIHNANPDTPERAFTTVAEIDISRLRKNAQRIRELAMPSEVMAVVKANAYGHGALRIVQILQEEGFKYFMVASLSEALHLRSHGIHNPILIALPPLRANLPIYSREHFLVSVSSEETCSDVLDYARSGGRLDVHVKLDTGMNRLGLSAENALAFIEDLNQYPTLHLQGIWTHLATAGAADTSYAEQQISSARSVVDSISSFSGLFHVGNSSSLIHPKRYLPPSEGSMYRIGGGVLGISAMPERAREVGLLPIMTLKSHVLTVKPLAAGETVSYGRKWTAPEDTRIAIVGAGYADGYPSASPNQEDTPDLQVAIKGRSYPVVGSVCMDMFMIDLGNRSSEHPVQAGDEVILFGQGGHGISELSRLTKRKAYEISCSISNRVVRLYK